MRRAVDQLAAPEVAGDADQQAFQVFNMSLGQVLILAGNQTHPFPEVLSTRLFRAVMAFQALGHIIGLTDIHSGAQIVVRVGANQEVHTSTGTLWALHQLGQFGTGAGQYMSSPVHDLGSQQAIGRAIHQKQTQTATLAHTASRRSIWPVTAAVIRAERRSLRRAMLCSLLVARESIRAVWVSSFATIASCL